MTTTYVLIAALVLESLMGRYFLYKMAAIGREERRELEDRLIALTDKDASILVHAQEKPEPGDVTYVDEEREWELSPAGGGRSSLDD